jgi:hypothetical protein
MEPLDAFADRAALYADWDRRLRHRTRFFAAATPTNAALVAFATTRDTVHMRSRISI